jgi:uncharacterized UPF0146 family protein
MVLVDQLGSYHRLVEVGIGCRTAVARGLAAGGSSVVGVDMHDREVPGSVEFVRDDVTDPDHEIYAGADAIYGLRLPPELHRPVWRLARYHDAEFLFTTLGTEPPTVTVEPEQLPGVTLYRARVDHRTGN